MSDQQATLIHKIKKYCIKTYGNSSIYSQQRLFEKYSSQSGDTKTLSSDELSQLLKDANVGNGLTRGAWVRGITDRLDSNQDKQISWEEYRSKLSK